MPGVDGWVGGGHTTVLSPDQHIPLPRVSKNHRLNLKNKVSFFEYYMYEVIKYGRGDIW